MAGPLILFFLSLVSFVIAQSKSTTGPKMEWKILCIIKQESTAACPTNDCAGKMNDTGIGWVGSSFLNTLPTLVHDMTGGVVRYNTEVVISPTPLKKMDQQYYMAMPENMQDDIDRFNVTVANYDHVYVVGPWTHWAFWTNGWFLDGVSWSSSNLQPFNTSNPTGSADYLHETIHGLDSWYYNNTRLGTKQNPHGEQDDLDTMVNNPQDTEACWGYTTTSGGSTGKDIIGADFDHYNKLYMDILNGRVCHVSGPEAKCDPPPTQPYGLGPNAWKYPTRREAHHNLPAGYMAAHGTYPGEPATVSSYQGPGYTGYTSPRHWNYAGGGPRTDDVSDAYRVAGKPSGGSHETGTVKMAIPFGNKAPIPTPSPSPASSIPASSPAGSGALTSSMPVEQYSPPTLAVTPTPSPSPIQTYKYPKKPAKCKKPHNKSRPKDKR